MNREAVSRQTPGNFMKNFGKTLIFVAGQRQYSGWILKTV
jgi:hypothetical protein